MTFSQSCIESFVRINRDIAKARTIVIFMINQCSHSILLDEQIFALAQVLISIVTASNTEVQFQQDIDFIFIVPESVRNSDVAFDNNTKNTCMKDSKNIIEKLSGRYLFEDYSKLHLRNVDKVVYNLKIVV